jgi:hypothetical protein
MQRESAISNPQRRSAVLRTGAATPPAPTGLRVVPNISTVTVVWNPINLPVLYYEVMVSASRDMSDPTTFKTSETTHTYDEGDPEVTYYFQVRAVASTGISDWSAQLNSTTGTATYKDLETGSATQLVYETFTEFNPSYVQHDQGAGIDGPRILRSEHIPFTTIESSIVSPRFTVKFLWESDVTDTTDVPQVVVSVLVDEIEVDDATNDWMSTSGMEMTATIGGLGRDVPLDAGDHLFVLEIWVYGGSSPNNFLKLTPERLDVSIVEFRN